jgi:hypothetical protein
VAYSDLKDACAHAWCDPTTGLWLNEPIPASCADFNFCTVDTVTEGGKCEHTSFSCDDGNACTIDNCNPKYSSGGKYFYGICHYQLAPECAP